MPRLVSECSHCAFMMILRTLPTFDSTFALVTSSIGRLEAFATCVIDSTSLWAAVDGASEPTNMRGPSMFAFVLPTVLSTSSNAFNATV